eukprot:12332434-Alexandrium_andersonii.AAC.1
MWHNPPDTGVDAREGTLDDLRRRWAGKGGFGDFGEEASSSASDPLATMAVQNGEGADALGALDAGLQNEDIFVAAPPPLQRGRSSHPLPAGSSVQND